MESLEFSGSSATSPEEETRTQRASHPEAPRKPLTRRTPSLRKAVSGQAREPQEPAPPFLQESGQTEEADGPTLKGVFDDTESSRFSRGRTPFSIYRPYDPFDSQFPSEPAEPPNPTKTRSPRTDRSPARLREPPTPQDELFSQDNILVAPSLTTRTQPRRSLTPECGRCEGPPRGTEQAGPQSARLVPLTTALALARLFGGGAVMDLGDTSIYVTPAMPFFLSEISSSTCVAIWNPLVLKILDPSFYSSKLEHLKGAYFGQKLLFGCTNWMLVPW